MKKYIIEREIPNVGTLQRNNCSRLLRNPTRRCANWEPIFNGWNRLLQRTKRSASISPKMKRSSESTPNSVAFRRPRSPRSATK